MFRSYVVRVVLELGYGLRESGTNLSVLTTLVDAFVPSRHFPGDRYRCEALDGRRVDHKRVVFRLR